MASDLWDTKDRGSQTLINLEKVDDSNWRLGTQPLNKTESNNF